MLGLCVQAKCWHSSANDAWEINMRRIRLNTSSKWNHFTEMSGWKTINWTPAECWPSAGQIVAIMWVAKFSLGKCLLGQKRESQLLCQFTYEMIAFGTIIYLISLNSNAGGDRCRRAIKEGEGVARQSDACTQWIWQVNKISLPPSPVLFWVDNKGLLLEIREFTETQPASCPAPVSSWSP